MKDMKAPTLSIIIPAYEEEGNIERLYEEITQSLAGLIKNKEIADYEVIFINDGSKDRTQLVLEELKNKESNRERKLRESNRGRKSKKPRNKQSLKIIQLRKNFGQTPALKAGFDNCKGDLILTMDADLQNDPKDIPRLLSKLKEGYDVVSGWRYNRRDSISKKISSRMMNNLRIMVIGDRLHDYGCSLKIYKKECLKDLELFGELHRYVTAYLYIKGYRIGEIKVNHRPRLSGRTKYKFSRGLNGILDLFYLRFWSSYSSRPLHFFGRLGVYQWILAFIIIIEQIIKALIIGRLTLGPLLMLAAIFGISGLLFIIFGFLSEIMIRSYFRTGEKIYNIKKIL